MQMQLWQSIPFASILLPLGSAAMTSVLRPRAARVWTGIVLTVEVLLSTLFFVLMTQFEGSYTYMMGHYPAPWGNELRAGLLEAALAQFFSLVMLLSLLGGAKKLREHILSDKHSLYDVLLLLLCASLMAQIYTNDIFTAYVFVEIMTISAAALIAARSTGRTLVAATRYMVMNLIGSALFLLGVIMLYDLTGHLLMSNIREKVAELAASGEYHRALTVVVALICVGLAIKSALSPFHTWVPDAYGYSTPTSAAILSSLVSKGYILLLVKVMYRVIGQDVIALTGVDDVLLLFGLVGMVLGSVIAIRQMDVRRMVAYSSVSQIGYIYMGIGLGTEAGMVAAVYYIIAHAVCKAMLFLALGGLVSASGDSPMLNDLRGAGKRAPLAGVAFTVGALTLVGVPFLGGFIGKLGFAMAALELQDFRTWAVLAVLIASTALNAVYFMRAVLAIYRPAQEGAEFPAFHGGKAFAASLAAFVALSFALGLCSAPLLHALTTGLATFG